jgi:CheY-like chemotaxis protein
MRVIAVLPEATTDWNACGLGVGVLARKEIDCLRVPPSHGLVDQLVVGDPPDLVMLDADTPAFAALHAVRSLRRFSNFMLTPIFVVSERDWSNEAKAAGATAFFKKPIDVTEMEEAVAKHVRPVTRKAPRRGIRGPCVVSKGGVKYEGRICDVSVNGAQVSVNGQLPLGAMVHLGFAVVIQKNPHIIKCNARVVREVPGGYGLAFCALDVSSRSLLVAYSKS